MAIPLPVTRSKISTTTWGIPITEEVNRLTLATAVTPWTALTLTNGWTYFGGGKISPQYRKVGDMVQVRFAIQSGPVGSSAFTLPVGFRPPGIIAFVCVTYQHNVDAAVDIHPDGQAYVSAAAGYTLIQSGSIQFSTI